MSFQDSLFSEDVEYDVTEFSKSKRSKRDLKSNGAECKSTEPLTKTSESFNEMGAGERQSSSVSPGRGRAQRQGKSSATAEIYRPPAARRLKNNGPVVEQTIAVQQATAESLSASGKNRQKRPDRAVYVPRHRRSLETEGSPQPVEHPRLHRTSLDRLTSAATLSCASNSLPHNKLKVWESSAQNVVENGECEAPNSTSFRELRCQNLESRELISERCNEDLPQEVDKLGMSDSLNTDNSSAISEKEEKNLQMTDNEQKEELNEDVNKNNEDDNNLIIENEDSQAKDTMISVVLNIDEESVNRHCENNSKQGEQLHTNTSEGKETIQKEELINKKNKHKQPVIGGNVISDVLIISENDKREKDGNAMNNKELIQVKNCVIPMTPPGKKVKKIERLKSKPAPPPSPPPVKMNRDECDWDTLFDDNGDCLDPTLIAELTATVGDVVIEQPKSDYKAYTKQVEVSSDEYAHVLEIYNFPSDFKTSDLAAVFSPFKNGGFELKWVDDTHCLGVFSSPLIAAEVLASNHPFVKTRPLSEATALSKTKARRSAEFLQPYRSRPETCAALARRLVTGALGVRLATASQEREREKILLREAKEKRRLANKQREDAWEGIIPGK